MAEELGTFNLRRFEFAAKREAIYECINIIRGMYSPYTVVARSICNALERLAQSYAASEESNKIVWEYTKADAKALMDVFEARNRPRLTKVIFSGPATITFWSDGDKVVVKCHEDDTYDPEKGLAMAVSKKFLGTNTSKSNYRKVFNDNIPEVDLQDVKDYIDNLKKAINNVFWQ